jgi:hypothetical protein
LKTVLSFSIFKGAFSGHGGEKRTKQIQTLLSAFDHHQIVWPFQYKEVRQIPLKTRLGSLPYYSQAIASSVDYNSAFNINALLEKSYRVRILDARLKANATLLSNAAAVVWENNFPEFLSLPYLVKNKYGRKIIACPQNLESLTPMQSLQWTGSSKIEFLNEEISALRHCDAVFTISEEEEWLLNLLDIPAKFLPYYPIGVLYQLLLNIRQFRAENAKHKYFLIVGSVSNPPTRLGMINLLKSIDTLTEKYRDFPYRFKVTGYGTEALAKEFNNPVVDILGATTEEDLNDMMRNCRAMVISQGFSSGALTKIPEMLVAGIPVITDNGSSRSYKRTEGLHVFNSPGELADLMSADLPVPPVPDEPVNRFTAFKQVVIADKL